MATVMTITTTGAMIVATGVIGVIGVTTAAITGRGTARATAMPTTVRVRRRMRGLGYRYSRGARYYDAYRGPVYVVDRYPDYHLRRPPYGYHWVRDDRGNFLMVAIATGIIADIVLNH
jgi:Ni/Co efflux regulator RcnB